MWTQIETHISQITNNEFEILQKKSVSGGSINESYAVSDGQYTYFVKLNQASQIDMFQAEALGLQQIFDTATIRVPKALCSGIAENSCYLVLEWLEMGRGNAKSWEIMGRKLAAMHKVTNKKGFGWYVNNTIGSTPQVNTLTANWAEFYTQHRMKFQLRRAKSKGGRFPQAEELLAAIPELLAGHKPQPSLVHGDLWGGNAGFTVERQPVIFDPAIYYGDREVDIAMTELFGGFPPEFYRGYSEVFPLNSGYDFRKTLYNLYHVVNHFNLFGSSYEFQANQMISQLLR
ncbi:MAG: fructosamine kinase family protein [Methylacidiphilales bacterium]|nr:fructosamine kinase family protein [Candidatus Methylacidiphilales bacterium]NJR18258.1 fructosamine kinase family protein [Calothrix sp. CSU_2_0]